MGESERGNRAGLAAALLALLALGLGAAIFLDIGPFADEELSGQTFLERGDQICGEARDEFAALQRTPPRTPQDAADLTRELIGIAEEELDEIGSLAAPADIEPALDRYLAAREEGIAVMRHGVEAAEAEDPGAYERLQAQLERTQPERLRLARRVGFSRCSRPLDAR